MSPAKSYRLDSEAHLVTIPPPYTAVTAYTMNVVNLAERRSRETIAALRHLLAEAEAGRIRGVAVAASTSDGALRVVVTDSMRLNPSEAMCAATRMCLRVSTIMEEAQGWPLQRP